MGVRVNGALYEKILLGPASTVGDVFTMIFTSAMLVKQETESDSVALYMVVVEGDAMGW